MLTHATAAAERSLLFFGGASNSGMRKHQGKIIILAVLGVCAGLSGYAVYYQYQASDAALAFWGRDAALLIGRSPDAELLLVTPARTAKGEKIETGGDELTVVATVPAAADGKSLARGLTHLRHALLMDSSFDFSEPADNADAARWRYAVRFSNPDGELTVVFDAEGKQLAAGERIADSSAIATGVAAFFEDHFPPEQYAQVEGRRAAPRGAEADQGPQPKHDGGEIRRDSTQARDRVPTRSPERPA